MKYAFIRWLALPLLVLAPALLVGCDGFTIGDLGSIGVQDESSQEGQKPEVRVALDAPQAFERMDVADAARQRALATGNGEALAEAVRNRPYDYEYKLLWAAFRVAENDRTGAESLHTAAARDFASSSVGHSPEAYASDLLAFDTSVLAAERQVLTSYKKQGKFVEAERMRKKLCADEVAFFTYHPDKQTIVYSIDPGDPGVTCP